MDLHLFVLILFLLGQQPGNAACPSELTRAGLEAQGKVVWADHLPEILRRLQSEGISLRQSKLRENNSARLRQIVKEVTGQEKSGRNIVMAIAYPYRGQKSPYLRGLQHFGVIPHNSPLSANEIKKPDLESLIPVLISHNISLAYWSLHSNNSVELRDLIFKTIGLDVGGASIVRAAIRLYGSWPVCLSKFGIDTEVDAGYAHRLWGKNEIRLVLQHLYAKVPLNPGALQFDDSAYTSDLIEEVLGFRSTGRALYLAAINRYSADAERDANHSAYWHAVKDAGLDPQRIYAAPSQARPRD